LLKHIGPLLTCCSPVTWTVLNDDDCDSLSDLDDEEMTSQIKQILEGERVGKAIPVVVSDIDVPR
jgi:hypothetical protein